MGTLESVSEKCPEEHLRTPEQDLELWKHHAEVGGADKNAMVTVVSWLLGFSSLIIGYFLTSDGPLKRYSVLSLAVLGIVISAVALVATFVYGGYANLNWTKADEIARRQKWRDLLPDNPIGKTSGLTRIAVGLARPRDPEKELAPVFVIFAGLATASALTHIFFLIWPPFPVQ